MDMFGVFDLIIILFVLLWRIGLPIVLAYVLLRVW